MIPSRPVGVVGSLIRHRFIQDLRQLYQFCEPGYRGRCTAPLFPMNPNNSSALPLLFLHQPNTNRASSLVRQGLDRCEQKLQEHPYLCGHKACYRCTWHIGQPINTKSHVVCNTILFQVPGTRSGYKYLVRARCDMCTCDTPKFWSRSSVADPLTLPSFQSHPFQYLNSRSYKYRTFRPRDDRTLYQFRSFLISDASSVMLPTLIPCR
jgi:hypothetical protein